MNRNIIFKILIPIVGLAVVLVILWQRNNSATESPESNPPASEITPADPNEPAEKIVAGSLKIPWEIVFLPDSSMLVTERVGTIQRITPTKAAIPIQGVRHVGEGGLLGMAIHPKFKDNHFIYLYLTTQTGGGLTNRVERYKLDNDTLSDRKIIIEGIPGASNHDGGRLAFGPDGDLYITTGDAELSSNAQNTSILAGKILRLKDDGSLPADNPFGNAVYSYGHRNPQGLAWDNKGRLWATEHGRSGQQSGFDELNLIEKGKNYGWPTIQGDQTRDGMQTPAAHSGATTTWAPSGLTYMNGILLFAGLRGESLYAAKIKSDNSADVKAYLRGKYGRLRAVVKGPDGYLYISTSNTDGRGQPTAKDDRIIRVKFEF